MIITVYTTDNMYGVQIDIEPSEIDIYRDGIGHYEYHGVKGYDNGNIVCDWSDAEPIITVFDANTDDSCDYMAAWRKDEIIQSVIEDKGNEIDGQIINYMESMYDPY